MVGMRNLCVRLAMLAVGPIAMVVAWVVPATAQTVVDATTAEFQPSPDHSVTSDGIPRVTSYLLQFFPAGSSSPSHSIDIGKPAPDADGLIRFRFTPQLEQTPLVPGTTYEARVSAVGPGGSSTSGVSNPFTGPPPPPCTFAIDPTSRNNVAAGGESFSVAVTAGSGCNWPATTSPVSWIVVTSVGSGSGNGTVNLNVTANSATTQRTGTVTIAGQMFAATQGPCGYSVTPASLSVPSTGAASTFSIGTTSGCPWSATGMPSWITIPSGQQTGPGSLSYTIATNTGAARSATLAIAGKSVLVSQGANTIPAPPANLRVVRSGGQ